MKEMKTEGFTITKVSTIYQTVVSTIQRVSTLAQMATMNLEDSMT